jgi:NAD+ kinase
MKPLRKISILANASKLGAEKAATRLQGLAENHGVEAVSIVDFPVPDGFLEGSDACFVVGGDGTLLNVMEEAVRYNVPVAGIRHGQLGFLATFSPEDMEEKIPPLFKGEYRVSKRSMLRYRDENGFSKCALNDLVVKSGTNGKLGRFSVSEGRERVAEYACDGIVFSTPTGSTAYNLAAGGPIAHPEAQVLLMTPISAHTLTSRSVVFPSGVSLSIQSERNPDEPLVSADGQPAFEVPAAFPIEVRVADQSFPLLEEKNHSHFHILRSKLKWG